MFNKKENLISLDIQQARVKFILFKSKLRSILYGAAADDSIFSPRTTPLGQWLYEGALLKYNAIPEVREIERLNLTITNLATQLFQLFNEGKIEESRQGLEELNVSEDALIRLLGIIQNKVDQS